MPRPALAAGGRSRRGNGGLLGPADGTGSAEPVHQPDMGAESDGPLLRRD